MARWEPEPQGRVGIGRPSCGEIDPVPVPREDDVAGLAPRILEEDDLGPAAPTDPLAAVPTPFPRDMEVEETLRATRGLYPAHEVRILNWHRPKRDV